MTVLEAVAIEDLDQAVKRARPVLAACGGDGGLGWKSEAESTWRSRAMSYAIAEPPTRARW